METKPSTATTQQNARRSHSKRERRNDKEECASCNKSMVPRLYFNHGILQSSLCPFCGATHKDLYVAPPPGIFDAIGVMVGYIFKGIGILLVLWILFVIFAPPFEKPKPSIPTAPTASKKLIQK